MNPKILVTRSSMPKMDEYINEIKDIWDSCWLTNMGPKHKQLQSQLKEYLDVENVELFTNGHMALELSLQALDLKGEVITTPFTFVSTTHAIVRNGLTPVFCDINPVDFTIDTEKIESLITENTSAIMPVHVYGNICDVDAIEKIAQKYNLKVIYDAAHTFGIKYKGKGIGSFGDVSCFSFHATKVFNTIEGGAACFNNKEFGEKICRLKNFGIYDAEKVIEVGTNAKLNEFSAAMGICNLRHIDDEIAKRRVIVERYMQQLSQIDGIYICPPQQHVTSNYAYFPIVVDEVKFGYSRDDIMNRLAKDNIYARKYFFPITNSLDCFDSQFDVRLTPVALHISDRVLTLPLYADLSLNDVDRICEIIKDFKSF